LGVLQIGAEAWDTAQMARPSLAKYGLTFTDDRGMVRARPEAAIMRDNRSGFLRALRDLGLLKIEPPKSDRNGGIGISWRDMRKD
jgi:hypothetical protein